MKHTEKFKRTLVEKARKGVSLEKIAKVLDITPRSALTYFEKWAKQESSYGGEYVQRLKQEFYGKYAENEKHRKIVLESIPDLVAILLFTRKKISLQETSNILESVFGFRFHIKFLESHIQEEIGEMVVRDNGYYYLKTEGNGEYRAWLEDYKAFLLSKSRFHHYKFNYIVNRNILNQLLTRLSS